MDGMEDKINAFLSNPDALDKVMNMARALGGGGEPAPAKKEASADGLGALTSLASSLGGESSSDKKGSSSDGLGALLGGLQDMDPKLLSGLMGLISEYGNPDSGRESLLLALKPYLRSERQEKIDKAAQMMRMARTARLGLKTFLGGRQDA